jgi:drug/metabolite transporter (DMT)-like permease
MPPAVSPIAILVLLTNTLIWGLSWTAFKSLRADGMHPVWATAIIFAGCTLLMLLYRPRILREIKGQSALILVAITAGLTNTTFNTAVAYGDVVRVILLFYLMPIWAILLARIVLHEPITLAAVCRIALGLCGAMIVLYQPGMGLPLPSHWVDWVAIAGGMAFAANNIMLRRLQGVSDGARAITMLGGGGLFACLMGIVISSVADVAWPTSVGVGAAIWHGTVAGECVCGRDAHRNFSRHGLRLAICIGTITLARCHWRCVNYCGTLAHSS